MDNLTLKRVTVEELVEGKWYLCWKHKFITFLTFQYENGMLSDDFVDELPRDMVEIYELPERSV